MGTVFECNESLLKFTMNQLKAEAAIGYKYVLITMTAVVFSWMLHEFAHWIVGELLGNDMIMTLNTCYPKSGVYIANWHSAIISGAGPLITIAQALTVYYLLINKSSKILFPFLLTCLYMRTLAGAMNFINLNDEGRISVDLGLGTYTLSIGIVAILFYLTYRISKKQKYTIKLMVVTILLIMLFSVQ